MRRMDRFEKKLYEWALRKHDYNITQTSKYLGVTTMTVRSKIEKYNIEYYTEYEVNRPKDWHGRNYCYYIED
jgi:DNA-binding NtrC family response regulator